jgi:GNAT superfamily N-acetyltransferase
MLNYVRITSIIIYGCPSLAALNSEEPIGFISTYPKKYPEPLPQYKDAYIDVLEVDEKYKRLGIARQLILTTENWAREYGYRQIRSWSSQVKKEAIPMWYALNYCMCPARIWIEWRQKIVDLFYVAKML